MSGYREVCAAVRDWQLGLIGPDDVTAVALEHSAGDRVRALATMRAACAWWLGLGTFKDRNGEPVVRRR